MVDPKRANAVDLGSMVMVYGCPPPEPWPQPGDFDPPFPIPDPPRPFAPAPTALPTIVVKPALTPCAACKRHIVAGTECPFCFASSSARAGDMAADAELLEALERWIRSHHAITEHGKLIRRAAERLRRK